MITEPLTWHVLAASPADLPDADLTVVIELDPAGDASEPVWLGFFDGSGWLDAMGDAVQVIAWADMPKGTAGVPGTSEHPAADALRWAGFGPEDNAALIDCEGTSPCSTCPDKGECGRSGCVRIAQRRNAMKADAGSAAIGGAEGKTK